MIVKLKFEKGKTVEYVFDVPKLSKEYLLRLKRKENLSSLVANCKNDYEIGKRLCSWTSHRMGNGQDETKNADPISILEDADRGKRLRCVESAILLKGCLNAFGIPARTLALKVKNIETIRRNGGHVVVEAYSNSYKKWVMYDPQFGASPLLGKIPLTAVELQSSITNKMRGLKIFGTNKRNYIKFVYKYLFYFDVRLNSQKLLRLIPIGYENPKIFQRTHLMKNVVYTHSLSTFYQKP
jgi:transglutaminase-like putative cysteine protease